MRAVTTVISIILITGIVTSLVTVAYMWGVPLIEKGTILNQYRTSDSFIKDLNRAIVEIANTGAGSRTLDIPTGALRLVPNKTIGYENNSLILEFQVNQPLVFSESLIPIDTPTLDEPGTYGVDKPGTMVLYSETVATGYQINLKLHYRTLESGTNKGYRIVFDGESEERGISKITISFDRTETITGGCCNGAGDLTATYIRLDLV